MFFFGGGGGCDDMSDERSFVMSVKRGLWSPGLIWIVATATSQGQTGKRERYGINPDPGLLSDDVMDPPEARKRGGRCVHAAAI